MRANLKSYHYAWLAAHPNRSEEWLRERLADGFDVHHVDGSKENEQPRNLILIEHGDHMGLHGMPIGGELSKIIGRRGGLARAKSHTKQERILAAMRASNVRWRNTRAKRKRAELKAAAFKSGTSPQSCQSGCNSATQSASPTAATTS